MERSFAGLHFKIQRLSSLIAPPNFEGEASKTSFFICADEIDAIAGKRESAQREMERRIVAQMLTCMDDLAAPKQGKDAPPDSEAAAASVPSDKHVLVIGEFKANEDMGFSRL